MNCNRLFLDSGAFSALTQNTAIDIDEYIEYIKNNERFITVYANLDVIGSAEETYRNQKKMEESGLSPLPVFHLQDNIKYLHTYMNAYNYICVGGMAKGYSASERYSFFNRIFQELCPERNDYFPLCKVHGFGMTDAYLLCEYPWYSVDSTTPLMQSINGSILVPKNSREGWFSIGITERGKKEVDSFYSLSPGERISIEKHIASMGHVLGTSVQKIVKGDYELNPEKENWVNKKEGIIEKIVEPGLCNSTYHRFLYNSKVLIQVQESLPKWPWKYLPKTEKGFF